MPAVVRSRPESGEAQGRLGFRPDIEGLRAVAVAAVVLDHAGVPFLGGGYVGVDVFFVISGFLITRMLVSEAERTGSISLPHFYARRARRLLPQALLVLAAISLGSALLFSAARNDQVSGDVIAAGVYVVNWRFAAQAVDYFGAALQASPVQHFWSLAVEEQFYIVWPAILIGLAWWRRRRGRTVRPAVWAAVVLIGIGSLVYGAHLSSTSGGAAYFSTLARAWELAIGGALALVLTSGLKLPRVPPGLAGAFGWVGFAGILAAAVHYGDDTPFPGTAAVAPALGTVAIIFAGALRTDVMPQRLLTARPMRYVGRISYAWYLWHWPMLVFAAALWGTLSAWAGLAVALVSLVPTVLSHHFVEEPVRHSGALVRHPRKGLKMGAAFAATAVFLGLVLPLAAPTVETAPARAVIGAEALTEHQHLQVHAHAVRPNPRDAEKDRGQMYYDGCLLTYDKESSPPCAYGDVSSDHRVVLFGDSHAMQYGPALAPLARREHWRLEVLTKEGCSPAAVAEYVSPLKRAYTECAVWRENTLKRIADEHPALVLVSSSTVYRVYRGGRLLSRAVSAPLLRAGYETTLRRLRAAAGRVVLVQDPPRPPADVADCVAQSLDHLDDCAFAASEGVNVHPFDALAAEAVDGVQAIDPERLLCPGGRCPAVVGNALVYRGSGHLSATFAQTMAPWFEERLTG